MVFLRTRQADDQVDLFPLRAGIVEGQPADDPRVRIQAQVVPPTTSPDSRVAGTDVQDGILGGPDDDKSGDLAIVLAAQTSIIVVVGNLVDQVNGLNVGSLPTVAVLGDVSDLDDAVLLGNIESRIWSKFQRGGIVEANPFHHRLTECLGDRQQLPLLQGLDLKSWLPKLLLLLPANPTCTTSDR